MNTKTINTCKELNCNNLQFKLNMCEDHYYRIYKHCQTNNCQFYSTKETKRILFSMLSYRI